MGQGVSVCTTSACCFVQIQKKKKLQKCCTRVRLQWFGICFKDFLEFFQIFSEPQRSIQNDFFLSKNNFASVRKTTVCM